MKEKPSLHRLETLAEKWLLGTITPEEAREYADWYNEDQGNPLNIPPEFARSEKEQRDRILANIIKDRYSAVSPAKRGKVRKIRYKAIAAALIVLGIGITLYFSLHSKQTAPNLKNTASIQPNDTIIKPGSNKAVLKLADGTLINLHQSKNGILAKQGNSQVVKTQQGQLVYQTKNGQQLSPNQHNVLSIPRGGKFSITLADGTAVWLNAASSLSYPCIFNGNEREVTLTGEAYFEVAHDAKRPFIVHTKGQNVKVLGTHFNINAYDDETTVKTTLLEGKVNVSTSADQKGRSLYPGQQAILQNTQVAIRKVNTEYAVAWQKGNFMFANENIQAIMREISRWYDVSIAYAGEMPEDAFGGTISRFEDVKQVLQILQLTGKVHFKIEGKKIIVSK